MTDLRALAHDSLEGRRVGTPGNARARDYIVDRLRSLDLAVTLDSFPVRGFREPRVGVNVVASIPARGDSSRYIVITAHYDHLGVRNGAIYNGASDNASGVAALLALAEAFSSDTLRHAVLFVATDAEEEGIQGARFFVSSQRVPLDQIAIVVNLDMLTPTEGDPDLYVVGTHQHPLLRAVVESVAVAPGIAVRFGHDTPDLPRSENWVLASDHGPFHMAGVRFLYLGVEGNDIHHQSFDESERVDERLFAAAVESARRMVVALDRHL